MPSKIYIDAQLTRGTGKTVSSRVWNRLLDIARAREIRIILTNLVWPLNGFCLQEPGINAICLDSKLSKRKRNLVLAHELGHIKLPNTFLRDSKYQILTDGTRLVLNRISEQDAQRFAKKLLRLLENREVNYPTGSKNGDEFDGHAA
jgi:Zn-dependent peptidase ImmA (M78 family)